MSHSYLDFEPDYHLKEEEAHDIIQLQLKDFRKEQLKIQLRRNAVLTVSGERPLDGGKWLRFRKEFSCPKDYKANEIRAKFSSGILYITIPKEKVTSLVTLQKEKEKEDPLTPVQQTSSSPVQDKGKLKEENTSNDQSTEAAAEAFTAKQPGGGDAITTPTETSTQAENATISPMARPGSLISRLKIETKTAIEIGASVVVLLALLFAVLFYVFKSYDPTTMDL